MQLDLALLNEIGLAFDHRPATQRFFPSAATQALCTHLRGAVAEGEAVLLLTGEAGSGKTSLVHAALRDMPGRRHVARLVYTSLSSTQMLRSIAYALGMPVGAEPTTAEWIEQCLHARRGVGETSLLVIDDAHCLPAEALPVLLGLGRVGDQTLLQMVLIGAPELQPRLQALTGLAADACFRMPGFSEQETLAYVQDRLALCPSAAIPGFTPQAQAELHARSQGLPGRINVLCRQLLHGAVLLDDPAPIDAATVAAQAQELSFHAAPVPAARVLAKAAQATAAATTAGSQPAPQRKANAALVLASLAALSAGVLLRMAGDPAAVDAGPLPARFAGAAAITQPAVQHHPAPEALLAAAASPVAERPLPFARQGTAHAVHAARTARAAALRFVQAQAAPAAARPLPVALAAGAESCSALLTQISLGEPLSHQQRLILESSCR